MKIHIPTKKVEKIAIFLGAGASAAEGAPVQSNLFKEYFILLKNRDTPYSKHERELITFFKSMFDIDVSNNLESTIFPTFEEALGILDLADVKNEAFRDFSNINFEAESGKIKFLRLYLLFLMADVINHSLRETKKIHRKLIRNLKKTKNLDKTVFLTTNYDIVCDNALFELNEDSPAKKVDYGVNFIDHYNGAFEKPDINSIKLLKLHGSLNWLHCPTCNNLHITPNQKGVYLMMTDSNSMRCTKCKGVYSPIIVPPTFYKDLSKIYLAQVWNLAETELLQIDHLIFCGYSFPDADIHIKYLVKRIQKNRDPEHKLQITVVNNYLGKPKLVKDEEENRYKRFLGENVKYTKFTFEEFADNPSKIIN